ncbi:hypothetical protein C8J43_104500 [Sphingomonas sp. PP-CE-1G-424]|nr:hypothetical protein C8J43_104500 [Sphingomonas sp. PP-CE-1G-424]
MDRLGAVVETNGTPLLLRERNILGSVIVLSGPLGHVYAQIVDHVGAIPPRAYKRASTSCDRQLALMDPNDVDADDLTYK